MTNAPNTGPVAPPPPVWNGQSSAAGTQQYAGFWLRVVASIIDTIILMIIGYIVGIFLRRRRRPPPTMSLPTLTWLPRRAWASWLCSPWWPGPTTPSRKAHRHKRASVSGCSASEFVGGWHEAHPRQGEPPGLATLCRQCRFLDLRVAGLAGHAGRPGVLRRRCFQPSQARPARQHGQGAPDQGSLNPRGRSDMTNTSNTGARPRQPRYGMRVPPAPARYDTAGSGSASWPT